MLLSLITVLLVSTRLPAEAQSVPRTCYAFTYPPRGPVGTLVTVSGTTQGCDDAGEGGAFGFVAEQAGTLIGTLPAQGPFSYRFRIPSSMAAGDWWAAAQSYDGGGPVSPGTTWFMATMGAPIRASFIVTAAPAGWADYASILAATPCPSCATTDGYDLVRSDGFVETFNAPNSVGDAGDVRLNAPIVSSASTPDGDGYWMLGADGGVFTYGSARFYGSAADDHTAYPFVGLAPTPDGGGYWLLTSAGGVDPFGDASFYGQARNLSFRGRVVGMAPPPTARAIG